MTGNEVLIVAIAGLFGGLMTVLGWNVKTLFLRLTKHEEKHESLRDANDRLRKDMHDELKTIYERSEKSTDKLREEIGNMSTSLRREVSESAKATNEILQAILLNEKSNN